MLWLDAHEFNYIQEVGTMNIFFKIDGKFITPSLDGAILDGITRKSVITILEDNNYEVEQRPITLNEVKEASANGTLEEAFGTGTAVGIAMIQAIGYGEEEIHVSDESPVGQMIMDTINGLRSGKLEDKHNWMIAVSE